MGVGVVMFTGIDDSDFLYLARFLFAGFNVCTVLG